MSPLNDPKLEAKLAALHAKSAGQADELRAYPSIIASNGSDLEKEARGRDFLSDKLVALDRDKGEFCYQICRAINAHNVVEIGTSFGVSTVYLAAAIRDNIEVKPSRARVIGTEHEPGKVAAAKALFTDCGLDHLIDLREGDLRETLASIEFPVDFVLIDIWVPVARPAIELVFPHLRTGAVVICDNTGHLRSNYREYFEFIDDPKNGFRTMTLPFDGGLEMSVRT